MEAQMDGEGGRHPHKHTLIPQIIPSRGEGEVMDCLRDGSEES